MPDEEKELTPLEEEREIAEQRPQLTSKQRLWQILLGWASGFLIWFCMALGLMFPENTIMSWLFLVVFAAAMFGRNAVERRTGMDVRLFTRCFLFSLIVFLIVFVIAGPVLHLLPEG